MFENIEAMTFPKFYLLKNEILSSSNIDIFCNLKDFLKQAVFCVQFRVTKHCIFCLIVAVFFLRCPKLYLQLLRRQKIHFQVTEFCLFYRLPKLYGDLYERNND